MNAQLDCLPWSQRQALRSARFAKEDLSCKQQVMRQTSTVFMDGRAGESSLDIATDVFEIEQKESGIEDPCAFAKAACEAEVLKWLPVLHENLQSSEDSPALATEIAAIGTIMN